MTYNIAVESFRPFTVSERQVQCPYASTLGYGKWIARPGDWITFSPYLDKGEKPSVDFGVVRIGRVLGRIEAPQDAEGWLYVLVLGTDACHLYPIWVKPEWVSTVQGPERLPAALLAWFTQPQLPNPKIVAQLANYGSLSVGYIDKVADRQLAYEHGVSPEGYKALLDKPVEEWPDTMLTETIRRARARVAEVLEDQRICMTTHRGDTEAVAAANELVVAARLRLKALITERTRRTQPPRDKYAGQPASAVRGFDPNRDF